jgi:hypothetical protein
LQDHPVDISDQLVTAHVKVGDKKWFILNRLIREASMLLFFCFQLCFICICSIFSCLA